MQLKNIIDAILDQRIWITDHADEEAANDNENPQKMPYLFRRNDRKRS
jgi:hypothetical protein